MIQPSSRSCSTATSVTSAAIAAGVTTAPPSSATIMSSGDTPIPPPPPPPPPPAPPGPPGRVGGGDPAGPFAVQKIDAGGNPPAPATADRLLPAHKVKRGNRRRSRYPLAPDW